MLLSIGERLVLLSTLPREGKFVTLKITRKLKEDLSFSEEEIKKYQFREEEDRVFWEGGDAVNEIEIGEKALDIIKDALKKLDESGTLKDEHYTLYEKFVKEEE